MEFNKQITELANRYQMKPEFIEAMEKAYDFIGQFSFVRSEKHLNNCVMEIKNGKQHIYKNIPARTRNTVLKAIKIYGPNGTTRFYSDFMKQTKLEEFVKVMIKNRIQPREFWEDGVITYRNLMYADRDDQTATAVFYAENK